MRGGGRAGCVGRERSCGAAVAKGQGLGVAESLGERWDGASAAGEPEEAVGGAVQWGGVARRVCVWRCAEGRVVWAGWPQCGCCVWCVSGNDLQAEGAKHLAGALPQLRALTELNLRGQCPLRDREVGGGLCETLPCEGCRVLWGAGERDA